MTDVRIICTHDAAKLAETLMRLLEAEEHQVHMTVGRQAMGELAGAKETRDAVLLIWSPDARSQTYMLDWLRGIDASRLVELSIADAPKHATRVGAVVDFANWRGTRGSAQWHALNDRLRAVQRALDPPKPPSKYAALALGMASAAAVTGALVLRMEDTPTLPVVEDASAREALVAADPSTGLGGPIDAIEPPSIEDELIFRRHSNVQPLRLAAEARLAQPDAPVQITLRDETLLERLSGLNPLRNRSNNNNN
jgi:hypothetical protein